jgi:hypothetical protein
MQNEACQKLDSSQLPSVDTLVAALTTEQLQRIHSFADHKLQHALRRPGMDRLLGGKIPQDLVNTVIAKFLMFESKPGHGRLVPATARRSPEAFVRWLMGAISSEITNLAASLEAARKHLPIAGNEEDEWAAIELVEQLDLMRLLERRDLQRVMFARLNQIALNEPALAPVVRYWEQHFEFSDRIGAPEFNHNSIERVRQHARSILKSLARELPAESPTGMEMLI